MHSKYLHEGESQIYLPGAVMCFLSSFCNFNVVKEKRLLSSLKYLTPFEGMVNPSKFTKMEIGNVSKKIFEISLYLMQYPPKLSNMEKFPDVSKIPRPQYPRFMMKWCCFKWKSSKFVVVSGNTRRNPSLLYVY